MKALIFNGAPDHRENGTPHRISTFLSNRLQEMSINPIVYNVSESEIPLFDTSIKEVPESVKKMNTIFREADIHIWLSPLYHGSMTGVMKNCLDWLEYSSHLPNAYLTGKIVGLVCWADGVQATQGVNTMDNVAKALRAWTLPYNVSIQRNQLFDDHGNISERYQQKFQLLIQLLINGPQVMV